MIKKAKLKKLNRKEIKIKLVIVCSVLALTILSFFFTDKIEKALHFKEKYLKNQTSFENVSASAFEVDYLDVGQGNSAFIRLPDGKFAVIDGGDIVYGYKIVQYLHSKNVDSIDYMIATHADADHIGGLLSVLDEFDVKNIYRPFQISGTQDGFGSFIINENEDLKDVYLDYVESTGNRSKISKVTTSGYAEFINKIYNEFYTENDNTLTAKVTVFYDGLKILGENYSFEFFAPLVRDDAVRLETITEHTYGYATVGYGSTDSNSNSAIFLFSCFNNTFFFTGDAPFTSGSKKADSLNFLETDFLNSLTEPEKIVLKNISVLLVGHHGSEYSTSKELLELLSPTFIVISVGEDNNFGHPHKETLKRINSLDDFVSANLLRTDKMGTISFGDADNKLKFAIESYDENEKLTISWVELAMITSIMMCYFVVFIKPKNNQHF